MFKHIEIPSNGSKISFDEKNNLVVPNNPIIPFIQGDGIGLDITPVMQNVVDSAVEKAYGGEKKIYWMEVYAGDKAVEKYGSHNYLPKENFLEMVCYVVSTNIERYANTRNAPQDAVSYVEKSVDRAFGTIIKRGTQETNPLYFKDRRVFIARKPDPNEQIDVGGKEKSLRQALVDAIVAEVAIESVEYNMFKKESLWQKQKALIM